ncbi:hypothetical protein TEA_007738 [Camellia sinensis var. sinensis]|uniref:Arginyl-tRNA synthetase catalytic core domain-containing protein n=1 Tax=Camellia sinensis var. sinensis TaxID=542762 RepID=A0A4V3WJ39_CAMSN|nr:hypothetical protein TEA_007738 [Camellia sinensis var. sinensis]
MGDPLEVAVIATAESEVVSHTEVAGMGAAEARGCNPVEKSYQKEEVQAQVEPGLSQLTVKQAPKPAKKSDEPTLKLANAFYKASEQRFDSDPEFKERAQQAVVSLQGGEEKYRKAWAQICEISRRGYQRVYQRLGIKIEEKVVN